jgi:hypothetical protein
MPFSALFALSAVLIFDFTRAVDLADVIGVRVGFDEFAERMGHLSFLSSVQQMIRLARGRQ